MIWLEGASASLAPFPSWAIDCDLKKFECALKNKNSWPFEKCFHVLFQVIITNEVPVSILHAYIPIPRHIRKGVFIRRVIASHLCIV